MTALTPAQVAQYQDEGYTVAEGAVPPDLLATLQVELDGWVEESRGHAGGWGEALNGYDRFDLEPGHTPEHPRMRRVNNPSEISAPWRAASFDALLADMVADAIGPDVKFVHSKINLKMPGADTVVGYHQDFAFVPHTNADMLTALLMLHDTGPENGGLEVVPGSHREGLESLWQDGTFSGTVSAEARAECERRAVPIAGPAGAVCLMAGHLLHASKANSSDRPRGLYITVYSAADAFMLWGNSLPNRLEGKIVRGAPSRRARLSAGLIEVRENYGLSSFFQIPGQASGVEGD